MLALPLDRPQLDSRTGSAASGANPKSRNPGPAPLRGRLWLDWAAHGPRSRITFVYVAFGHHDYEENLRSMRSGLGLLSLIVVTALAACGARDATEDNTETFREGQRTLDRLDAIPGATRQGRDGKAVLGDDGAPGETVRGATRQWRLHGRSSARDVLAHYALELRNLGYAPAKRLGDKSSHNENRVRGAACIEVLTGNAKLIITAAPRCSG